MNNPKFKIGDIVKIINSRGHPELTGIICKIGNVDLSLLNGSSGNIVYELLDITGYEVYRMRQDFLELHEKLDKMINKPKKVWNIAGGKPNFCVGCNTFNEYQEQAYVCFKCENGI